MQQYDICLPCDNDYLKYAAVLISSIVNTQPAEKIKLTSDSHALFIFHLLMSEISDENKTCLQQFEETLAKDFSIKIETHIVDDKLFEKYATYGENKNHTAYYKLLAPEIVDDNVNKVLCIDIDMVCCGDITEIFDIDLGDNIIAAAPDYDPAKPPLTPKDKANPPFVFKYSENSCYCAMGVILIDIPKWKQHNVKEKCFEILDKYNVLLPEQDAINAVIGSKIYLLPLCWNLMTMFLYKDPAYANYIQQSWAKRSEVIKNLMQPYITNVLSKLKFIHFAGEIKAWKGNYCKIGSDGNFIRNDENFQKYWIECAKNTPAFQTQLYNAIHQDDIEIKFEAFVEELSSFIGRYVLKYTREHRKQIAELRQKLKVLSYISGAEGIILAGMLLFILLR